MAVLGMQAVFYRIYNWWIVNVFVNFEFEGQHTISSTELESKT